MQREGRDGRTVDKLLDVGLLIREARWIHTEEVVSEHPTVRVGIALYERPPHLRLKLDEIFKTKLAH